MDDKKISLIFWDFGGVLAEEGFFRGVRAIAARNGRDPDVFFQDVQRIVVESGYVYGRCDEAAFWAEVRDSLDPFEGSPEFWREEILSRFVVRPWMVEVVRAARTNGLKAAMLSDQVNWLAELDGRHGFFKEFDKVFNSWDYGWTKSEPEFFHLALEAMQTRPEQALLIDDAPNNIAVARQVGLAAILYEDRESFARELAAYFPDLADRAGRAGQALMG